MTRARRPEGRERGAVLVEFAFVGLVLVTLLAGAFDYGMGWRTGLAANEGVRAGARVGSGQGASRTADFSLLSSMRAALESSGTLEKVERVVIFSAATTDGRVPSTCKNGNGSSELCNILTGDQFRTLATSIGSGALTSTGCINASLTKRWCPTSRNTVQLTAQYLGVWVRIRHDYMFPLLGDSITVERTAVMRLEPEDSGS